MVLHVFGVEKHRWCYCPVLLSEKAACEPSWWLPRLVARLCSYLFPPFLREAFLFPVQPLLELVGDMPFLKTVLRQPNPKNLNKKITH